jgi:arylsulfatase A-like enzyme
MGYFPDLLPTLCDAAGAPCDVEHDGTSFLPLLEGNTAGQQTHDYLYFEFMGQIAVRKGNWKYYRSKEGEEALCNLVADRHEDDDLKKQNPEVFADLKACIEREHRDYTPTETPVHYDPPLRSTGSNQAKI